MAGGVCRAPPPRCAARWRGSLSRGFGGLRDRRSCLLGERWGLFVNPRLPGAPGRIPGARAWGKGFLVKPTSWTWRVLLDFGGQSGGLQVHLPSPCTCWASPDNREEDSERLESRWRGAKEPFPAALGVGGRGGAVGPSTWLGSGRHTNPDRSGRHVLGSAPSPAILLPPPAALSTRSWSWGGLMRNYLDGLHFWVCIRPRTGYQFIQIVLQGRR